MRPDRRFIKLAVNFAIAWLAAFLVTCLVPNPVFAQNSVKRLDRPARPAPMPNYANPVMPDHLRALHVIDNSPANNPVSDAGAYLGRVLFYDRKLSKNGLVSCASCHTAAFGFDDQTRFSIGFSGQITRRSAMSLANGRFNPRGRYFRDERAATLEEQVIQPFTDPIEMGLMQGEAASRINERQWYRPLFTAAFGDELANDQRIAAALAQFIRSLVSHSSPYDKAKSLSRPDASRNEPFRQFSNLENRGKYLFFTERSRGGAGCASCHETDAFIMLRPRNNGLELPGRETDNGVGEITGKLSDEGLFRSPSLKNIATSAPYMHDGRFASLEDVIDHYSSKIVRHPNLSVELREPDGSPVHFNFNDHDKDALMAFLNTLTDEQMLKDERFSDPFISVID